MNVSDIDWKSRDPDVEMPTLEIGDYVFLEGTTVWPFRFRGHVDHVNTGVVRVHFDAVFDSATMVQIEGGEILEIVGLVLNVPDVFILEKSRAPKPSNP